LPIAPIAPATKIFMSFSFMVAGFSAYRPQADSRPDQRDYGGGTALPQKTKLSGIGHSACR
jgi:hypothetical protein